jgi:hypothetical protein
MTALAGYMFYYFCVTMTQIMAHRFEIIQYQHCIELAGIFGHQGKTCKTLGWLIHTMNDPNTVTVLNLILSTAIIRELYLRIVKWWHKHFCYWHYPQQLNVGGGGGVGGGNGGGEGDDNDADDAPGGGGGGRGRGARGNRGGGGGRGGARGRGTPEPLAAAAEAQQVAPQQAA